MSIILTFRMQDETDVLGSFENYDKALEEAKNHLINLNTDEEAIADDLGKNWTWKEAIERWSELTDGDEEFTFTETS